MVSLRRRISRLESHAPDQNALPEPPRVVGRPYEVCIAERIEWLMSLLDHSSCPKARHPGISKAIAELQTLYPEAGDAMQIWYNISSEYPDDEYEVNFQRYLTARPREIRGSDKYSVE